jgi:hypothetical protein
LSWGWKRLRAPFNEISLATLLIAAGLSPASAQTTLDHVQWRAEDPVWRVVTISGIG